MSKRPRLSLIIPARNDGFTGNFNWRFETALNYLADNLRTLGKLDEVEVVVTDWGSEVPLHRVLSLNTAAKRIVRFILVPPDLACQAQGDSEFPIVIAQNVAVRRSRGEYIAQTDSDILFTTKFLEGLFAVLDGHRNIGFSVDQSLIIVKRRHVPWRYVSRNPHIQELDWLIRHFGCFLPEYSIKEFGFAATGMMMMHQRLWQECTGYDERLIHWGWMEIDLGLRITRKYPWFNLGNLGVTVFHLEHYRRRKPTRTCNPMSRNNSFRPNNEDWGLGKYTLEVFIYPPVSPQTQGAVYEQLPSVYWNSTLLLTIAQVVMGGVGRWLKHVVILLDRFDILKSLFFYYSKGKRKLKVVLHYDER